MRICSMCTTLHPRLVVGAPCPEPHCSGRVIKVYRQRADMRPSGGIHILAGPGLTSFTVDLASLTEEDVEGDNEYGTPETEITK